jgi:hypothetical protein
MKQCYVVARFKEETEILLQKLLRNWDLKDLIYLIHTLNKFSERNSSLVSWCCILLDIVILLRIYLVKFEAKFLMTDFNQAPSEDLKSKLSLHENVLSPRLPMTIMLNKEGSKSADSKR